MPAIQFLIALIATAGQDPSFRTTVPVVLAPVTVTTRQGKYMDGLGVDDFVLVADGRERKIQLDTSDTVAIPLSVVILVQANNTAPAAILKIQKIGSMMQPLITGERGYAAVLAFGSELKLLQDFSNDAGKLTAAFRKLTPQSGDAARMIDGVAQAVRLFRQRPNNERRVLFVISESKDRGSKMKLEDAIEDVQMEGVTMFPIVFSAYVTPFTTRASDLPPPSGGGLLTAIAELARLGKTDTTRVFAESSGGRRTYFATLHGLESFVTSLGEELHSQYLLSYVDDVCSPGFHRIEVKVKSHPEAMVRARYGYWTGEHSCGTTAR